MVMIFEEPKALGQLMQKGMVLTFRTEEHEHKLGKDWATDRRGGKKLCDVNVASVIVDPNMHQWNKLEEALVTVDDLRPFVSLSGFGTWSEWVEAIKRRNPKVDVLECAGYLYLVVTRNMTCVNSKSVP